MKAGVLALTALTLVSCGERQSAICPKGKPLLLEGESFLARKSQAEACVANFAIRLAGARAPLDEIAAIVIDRCGVDIMEVGQARRAEKLGGSPEQQREMDELDLRTLRAIARFEIAQAQSGGCLPK